MDFNTAVTPPVLNISGCRPLRRKKRKQKGNEVQSVPKFDHKAFPSNLSQILLRTDYQADSKSIEYDKKFLAVMCLKNYKATVRIYHMYCTSEDRKWIDYHNIELIYKDKPYLGRRRINLLVETINPEALHRKAIKIFRNINGMQIKRLWRQLCPRLTRRWC